MTKNFWGHLHTVNKHKLMVFRLCCKAGIPWRGIVHDLSKYSPTEFWESVKYYQGGKRSPIRACKEENGYSEAWLHHKGRNKHHYEYWYDSDAEEKCILIPYKYAVEMICDTLAAGKVYKGKDWTPSTQIEYWNKVKERNINPKIKSLLEEVYLLVSKEGVEKVIKPKRLKELYKKHCC